MGFVSLKKQTKKSSLHKKMNLEPEVCHRARLYTDSADVNFNLYLLTTIISEPLVLQI